MSMMLEYLKGIASKALAKPVSDCVIAVSIYTGGGNSIEYMYVDYVGVVCFLIRYQVISLMLREEQC